MAARYLGASTGPHIDWPRIFAAFVLAILVAVAAILVLKTRANAGAGIPKLGGTITRWLHAARRSDGGRVVVLETRRLGMHGDVSLISFDDACYLVVTGPGGTVLLEKVESDHVGRGEP